MLRKLLIGIIIIPWIYVLINLVLSYSGIISINPTFISNIIRFACIVDIILFTIGFISLIDMKRKDNHGTY